MKTIVFKEGKARLKRPSDNPPAQEVPGRTGNPLQDFRGLQWHSNWAWLDEPTDYPSLLRVQSDGRALVAELEKLERLKHQLVVQPQTYVYNPNDVFDMKPLTLLPAISDQDYKLQRDALLERLERLRAHYRYIMVGTNNRVRNTYRAPGIIYPDMATASTPERAGWLKRTAQKVGLVRP
jgi:hypothetical protein